MFKSKVVLIVMISCLAFAPGLRSQYRYTITHPDTVGHYTYAFTSLDCFGEVCTAGGMKTDLNLSVLDSGKYRLMFFRSTDGGNSWIEQDPNIPPTGNHASTYQSLSEIDRVQQIDAMHAVAIGKLLHGVYFRFIAITSDGGATWQNEFDSSSTVETPIPLFDIDFSDTLTGIATGLDQPSGGTWPLRFFTTHDGGSTWNEAGIIPSYVDSTPTRFRIHSYGDEAFAAYPTYYSAEGVSVLYHTTDDWQNVDSTKPIFFPGWTWPQNGGDTTDTNLDYAAFGGEDTILAMAGMFVDSNEGPCLDLFRSLDGGADWSRIDFPDTVQGKETAFTLFNLDGSMVFIGGLWNIGSRICVSTDHGMSWETDTLLAGDTIFPAGQVPLFPMIASTNDGSGVAIFTEDAGALSPFGSSYLARIEQVTSSVNTSILPTPDIMVYPNPAVNTLTLNASAGTISILDPLGRSYTVPRNGNSLDISSLPSGVYFVSDGQARAKFVKE